MCICNKDISSFKVEIYGTITLKHVIRISRLIKIVSAQETCLRSTIKIIQNININYYNRENKMSASSSFFTT